MLSPFADAAAMHFGNIVGTQLLFAASDFRHAALRLLRAEMIIELSLMLRRRRHAAVISMPFTLPARRHGRHAMAYAAYAVIRRCLPLRQRHFASLIFFAAVDAADDAGR